MRRLAGVIAAAALVAAVSTEGLAQGAARPFNLGGQVSFGGDSDLGIGIRYENQLNSLLPSMPTLRAVGSFDLFFPGQGVDWMEFNIGAVYGFSALGSGVTPYAGGGLNIARMSFDLGPLGSSSNTEIGLNVIGGARFRAMGRMTPYAEVRLELGGGEQFVLTAGVLVF